MTYGGLGCTAPSPHRRSRRARPRVRRALAVAAMAWLAATAFPGPGAAQEPEPTSVWWYSFYKTVTYEFFANLADIPLYQYMFVGAQVSTATFTVVNTATAAAAYYVHEVVWNLYGPSMQESPSVALQVGTEKLIVYRVVSTARNLALAYALTGSAAVTVGFAVFSNVVDAAIYGANEYGWYQFGPPVATGAIADTSILGTPASATSSVATPSVPRLRISASN